MISLISVNKSLTYLHRHYRLVNLLCFKVCWLLLVLLQNQGLPIALAVFTFSVLIHPDIKQDIRAGVIIAALGIIMDSTLAMSGTFLFPNNTVPIWLMLLWLIFAFSLLQGFRFVGKLPLVWQVLAGALTGPLSYWAGSLLETVAFGYSNYLSLTVIGSCWAIALPFYFRIANIFTTRSDTGESFA